MGRKWLEARDSRLTRACCDNTEMWLAAQKLPVHLQHTLTVGSSWLSLNRERPLWSDSLLVLKYPDP